MDTTSAYHWPWDVLGIAANADERTVRRAYARLLKQQRPDEDAEAFQRLRYAYESALQMASASTETAVEPVPGAETLQASRATPAAQQTPQPSGFTPAQPEVHPREPDAFENAVQLWQDFVARRDQLESRRSLQDLFAAVINIQTRDELEWQALVHCLKEDAPATLRMNLSALLGWRDNAAHLRRRNAAIATLALDRVFADEDYNALRLRFANAMALLEGPQPPLATGAHALLRAGVRTGMEQLLTSLSRYHPNVVRLRLDSEKVEFWTTVLLSEPQQQQLRALRSMGWLRYGWVPVWLGATAASLCDDGSGRLTSIAMDTLGICTMWAALICGWPRIKQLVILATIGAIGFGFAGHWLATDPRAWPMPFAHGVLFAFFFSFAQQEWHGWLARRPRLACFGVAMWFAGFAALIVLLLQRDERSTQFAWALFTVMAAAGGVLATMRWNDLRRAVPGFFRGYVHLAWFAFALSKPDIIACVSAGLMSVWIIEELKQRRLSPRTAP
ncbi:J domain-containing protein [Paraburkholderia sediminicola]|uniref:J domain-containing protein n=1 Tax=Paraburkholderia sediminicola TaxID=458836 RepID=UPI0038B8BA64